MFQSKTLNQIMPNY